jgi:hypothetical protein
VRFAVEFFGPDGLLDGSDVLVATIIPVAGTCGLACSRRSSDGECVLIASISATTPTPAAARAAA